MFRSLEKASDGNIAEVEVSLDGKPLKLRSGVSLAAALIEARCLPLRYTPVSRSARAPFCMMGSCFECLVEVDGVNQRACQIVVISGMEICRPGSGS